MPNHSHHCKECQYLGYESPKSPEEKKANQLVDIYIHRGWRVGIGTFTRRWGSAPNAFAETPISCAAGPRWESARAAALKKGLLSD